MDNRTTSDLSEKKRKCESTGNVECSGCRHQYSMLLKILTQPMSESISESLNSHKEDLEFMRAILWLKNVIASVNEISFEDFLAVFSRSRGTQFQDLLADTAKRSSIPTFHGTNNDEYEPSISTQSSTTTIDLLFSGAKSRTNNCEKNMNQMWPETIECLVSDDLLSTTRSQENQNDPLLQKEYSNSSKLLSDNVDYLTPQLARNPLHLFRSFPMMSPLVGAASQNSLERRASSFTKRSNSIDKAIVSNCTPLSDLEADDSAYCTMQLIPQSSKTRIPPYNRGINCPAAKENQRSRISSRNYRRVNSVRPRKNLPESESPQRWNCNFPEKHPSGVFITESSSESETISCSCGPSSLSGFSSDWEYDKLHIPQTNDSVCILKTTTCSLGSLKGSLNSFPRNGSQLNWDSEPSSKSSILKVVRSNHLQKNDSEKTGSCESPNDIRRLNDLITPKTWKSHSETSCRSSVEPKFSPMTSLRNDCGNTFRNSGIHSPLLNTGNNSRLQEELDNCSQGTSRMQDLDPGDDDLFTPPPTLQSVAGEETVKLSSDYLDYVLNSLNVEEATFKFVAVILACFEDRSITRAYMKQRQWANTLEQEAVRTLLCFSYTVEAQTKSSKCTRAIVLMLYRLFDKVIEETSQFSILEDTHDISIVLEFLHSKEVCMPIIHPLILELESSASNLVSSTSAEQRRKSLCRLQVVMFAVKISLKKYRLIRADEITKDIAEEKNSEKQEEQWIEVLEKLSVILFEDFSYLAMDARALKNTLLSK